MKRLLETTKGKVLLAVVIVVAVVACGGFTAYKMSASDLKLKEDTKTVEFGQTVSEDPKEYLDLSDVKNKEEYLKEVKVEKNTKLVKDKKYEALGEYEVKVSDKKDKAVVKVTVKDTTKPKFNKITKIETFEGEKVDYKKYVKASDLQKVKLTFDDKEVKLSKKGAYTLKVTAIDASSNKSEKEVKVIVKEKPKAAKGSTIRQSTDKNGNVVSKVVPKKQTYSSSSSNKNSGSSKPQNNTSYNKPNTNKKPSGGSSGSSASKPSKPSNPIIRGLGNSGWKGDADTLTNRAYQESMNPNSKWFNYGFKMWSIDKNGTIWTVEFYK